MDNITGECESTEIKLTITRAPYLVTISVDRTLSVFAFIGKLLGAVGGITQGIKSIVLAYGLTWKWRMRNVTKAHEQVPLVVIAPLQGDTGTWDAQSAWNRKQTALIEDVRTELTARIARVEKMSLHTVK